MPDCREKSSHNYYYKPENSKSKPGIRTDGVSGPLITIITSLLEQAACDPYN